MEQLEKKIEELIDLNAELESDKWELQEKLAKIENLIQEIDRIL